MVFGPEDCKVTALFHETFDWYFDSAAKLLAKSSSLTAKFEEDRCLTAV